MSEPLPTAAHPPAPAPAATVRPARILVADDQADVLRLVVGQALRRVALGLGLGLAGALSLHRIMEGLLYGVGSLDLSVLSVVALLLLGTAWLASWLPARRAASVDPASVLRRG